MRIAAAIFDMDGTLIDSMPMWRAVMDWLLERHGATMTDELFASIESLALRDTCARLHDEWGLGDSGECLYEEVCAYVRNAYEHEVRLFPGAREFLDELAAAGVPMALASSTPRREVACGLAAHDLGRYFQAVVSTEDVGGRDKDFPDVYLEAARRLGADPRDTWVFEDAPFGVRTARRAGFAVCGLINDHDGRREEDVRPWCDVFVHGFGELSLALLRDCERPGRVHGAPLRALVVDGSPCPSSPALVAELAAGADWVACVDGGARACREAGVVPQAFVGDCDSAGAEDADWARAQAATCIRFPAEKYATDLALALDCARHEAERREAPLDLTLTCASGGRPDHALAVLGLLAGAGAASARIVEDGHEMRLLSPAGCATWQLGPEALGRTFSAIALEGGTRVTLEGMRWELDDFGLERLGDRGVSNVVTAPYARVTCEFGTLAAFLLWEA